MEKKKYKVKRKVEDPPKGTEHPEGALYIPWIELNTKQCQWSLGKWHDEPSNTFPCCGLPVLGDNKLGQRFCEYHAKAAKGR